MLGEKVKFLINENQQTGVHHIIWNGTNASEMKLKNGIYLIKLQLDDRTIAKRIIINKD